MEDGEFYDIVTLLSTVDRDFLVRNNGSKVKITSLREKFVSIYFVPSLCLRQGDMNTTHHLVGAYKELYPKGDFEIVLVAGVEDKGYKDRNLFNIWFSNMPWLAVPFSDQRSRKRLIKLGNGKRPSCVILDAAGKVLSTTANDKFRKFGAEWYPFTEQRIHEIRMETCALAREMSLTAILSTYSRDFFITNEEKKVPVSVLEGKVVGFVFYERVSRQTVKEYAEIYAKLKDRGENFEIVLISPSCVNDEISFLKHFKSMPWLALPYMDPRGRILDRIFFVSNEPLIIVEPGKKQFDEYASDVIRKFGIEAYPFTSKRPAEMETTNLKAMTLQSILSSGNRNFVFRNDGSKVSISELVGKNILLFIAEDTCSESHECLLKLLKWYEDIKSKDHEFEVIYIPRHYSPGCCADIIKCDLKKPYAKFSEMPWLTVPDDKDYTDWLCCDKILKIYYVPRLVAFGQDGRILTKEAFIKLDLDGIDAYPFTDNDLFIEIYYEIAWHMGWHWPIHGVDENGLSQ